MECPKCGFEQKAGSECTRCGVIFAKVLPPATPPPIPSARTGNATGKLALLLALVLVLAFLIYHVRATRELTYPPGILVNTRPQQAIIKNPVPWKKAERLIFPLAKYNLKARVLGKERYRFDPGADISPIDLALGWGPMSDQKVLDQLEIVQGNRRFVVVPADCNPPLPLGVLMANSANVHILPASPGIERKIDSLRIGSLVELSGYLVGIRERGQWTWVSSLSRTDVGDGACEVFWVDRVEMF